MASQIQLRRDTAANWTSVNPTLAQGEIGIETNTGYFKIGNGSSAWNSLSYAVSQSTNTSASPTFAALTTTGNMVVGGDLTVNGNSTFINTETLAVEDNIIVLNSGATGAPSLNAGIEVERGSSTNVVLRWNESTDKWQVSENGTDYYDVINSYSLETRFADEHWHQSVRLATAAVLPNTPTYTAGTLDADGGYGIGATLESSANARLVVDGIEAVTGNRILVKNQANALHNGIYDVTAQGSVSAHWILTRAADMNGSYADQIDKGETVGCQEGNDNYYQQFYVSSTGTGTAGAHIIGTDNITFEQYSGTASFNAGNGLTITGNTLNIVSEDVSRLVVSASSIDLAPIVQSDLSACPAITFVTAVGRDAYGRVTGITTADAGITLGANTYGDYVAFLTAGTGVTLSNNSGESATPTVAIGQDVSTSASVTFAKVTAPLTGDVTGNASTASTLQTARAISLNGDVSGSVSFNGSSDVTISATIEPNSVVLGTDTTGNYVSGVTAGTGITVTHTPGEGSTASIAVTANTYDAFGAASAAQSAAAAYTDSAISATNLDGLNNVTVPTPSSGDFLKWNGSAWVNDPINLGTDTVGNYMSDLTQGTGVTITHTPGEGSNATIAIGQAVGTSDSPTFASVNVNGSIVFEGTTANEFETTLSVTDPTADRTITLPNITGTVITTGDTGTVTSTMIADGTIVNGDINASAAIDKTKISGTAITAGDTGTVTSTMIADGTIVNGDINASAGIVLSKLASGTSGQVVLANGSGVPTYTTISGDITVNSSGVASIAANSVALGTDTTGNYVATITGGTGVTSTAATTGEGTTHTLSIGQAVATSSSVVFAQVETTGSMIVGQNLYVSGSVVTQNQTSLQIDDPFIYLASSGSAVLTDFGIAGNYNDGTYRHGGIFRDATDGKWKFFDSYTPEPTDPIDTGHASYAAAPLVAKSYESTVATGTAPLIVSSTTAVTNLNADLLDGQHGSYYAPLASPTFTGTVTLPTGTVTSGMILDGTIVNGDISTSAAIAHSKLANATDGQILLGTTTTGVVTATTVSGDVTINGAGVTAIGSGVIVNADINASAAIDKTKISGTAVTVADTGTVTSTMIADGTIVNADINASAAIALSKLASGTSAQVVLANGSGVPTYTTVSGDVTIGSTGVTAIGSGVIVDADINASAGIALSKLATSTAGNIIVYNASGVPTAVAETGDITISDTGVTAIASGVIVNADISATAAIDLGKLADVSTNAQVASYTLVLADKNKIVEISNASANTLTVPLNSSVAFPVGSQITFIQTGAGQTTITPATAGVTINGTPGLKLRAQWSSATLIKRATDTWVALGDLSA